MVMRIARILSAGVVLALTASLQPATCHGWSLPNPFASSESKAKVTNTRTVKKEPSVLEKVGTGTKNFFNKTGEALGLKKPEPKRYQSATAKPLGHGIKTSENKSWLPSMFPSEKKKSKPRDVPDWMSKSQQNL